MGRMGTCLFFFTMIGQSLGMRHRTMLRKDGKGKRWKAVGCRLMIKRLSKRKSKSRSEMQEASKTVRCTLLIGSAWCTEWNGTFDIFFEIEYRTRREEKEVRFNKRGQARMQVCSRRSKNHRRECTSEDRKHTSGGAFVAIDSNLECSCRQRRRNGHVDTRVTKEELPKHGWMCEEGCGTCPYTFGTQKVGPREMKP